MTESSPEKDKKTLTRREVLKSVGKYSAAATGAAVVALSADDALAQASSSNEWVCTDYYPWWLCWWLGLSADTPDKNYGGWNGFKDSGAEPDYRGNSDKPW